MLAPLHHAPPRRARLQLVLALLAAPLLAAVAPAEGAMRSVQLKKNLCKTTGGGKFVPIPGFRGERIDRRLLPDVRWMKRRFSIDITDGYSMSSVHSKKGEHPLGLAADIIPHRRRGGTWAKIDRLARKAEPRQNKARLPWRWVGYNGDANHGRGHHLHLSWAHNKKTRPGKPARWVLTRRCPASPSDQGETAKGGVVPRRASGAALSRLAAPVPELR